MKPFAKILAALIALAVSNSLSAEPLEKAEKTMHALMQAIAAGNYKAFLAPANRSFKESMPEDRFHRLFAELKPVLKKGYKVEYHVDYASDGQQTFFWKILPKAVDAELGAMLVLETESGKVAVFTVQ